MNIVKSHFRGLFTTGKIRHVRWAYLAILEIALGRAQNGITEDLTQIAYFEEMLSINSNMYYYELG
jgi:hypothetical protein